MSACELCWSEATRRHAGGEGESVTAVYHRLIGEDWCRNTEQRRAANEAAVDRPSDLAVAPKVIDLMDALKKSLASAYAPRATPEPETGAPEQTEEGR